MVRTVAVTTRLSTYLRIFGCDPVVVIAVAPEGALLAVRRTVLPFAVGAAHLVRAWLQPVGFWDGRVCFGVAFASRAHEAV